MRKNLLRTIKALRNIPCTLIIVGILKQEHIEQLKKNHEGVSKFSPSFFMPKAPTFTSWGFVIT